MLDTPAVHREDVLIQARKVSLPGELACPRGCQGLVVFAHGSGSGRASPRNRRVAELLNQAGLGTLLFDLLTPDEHETDQRTSHLRFDIGLLANRLTDAVDWLRVQPATRSLRLGLFGASTGAAAALVTAARRPESICAVVSRGGRPDLAGDALAAVEAPTLFIVGGLDEAVIEMNYQAARALQTAYHLDIVPGAGHLFEEPGALETAARLARDWFCRHLLGEASKAPGA